MLLLLLVGGASLLLRGKRPAGVGVRLRSADVKRDRVPDRAVVVPHALSIYQDEDTAIGNKDLEENKKSSTWIH